MILLILILIVVLIAWGISVRKGNHESVEFWQTNFIALCQKVTDYLCKGTTTKVMLAFISFTTIVYEGFAIDLPLIRVGFSNAEVGNLSVFFVELQSNGFDQNISLIFFLLCR